jgi:hypothetical protein
MHVPISWIAVEQMPLEKGPRKTPLGGCKGLTVESRYRPFASTPVAQRAPLAKGVTICTETPSALWKASRSQKINSNAHIDMTIYLMKRLIQQSVRLNESGHTDMPNRMQK